MADAAPPATAPTNSGTSEASGDSAAPLAPPDSPPSTPETAEGSAPAQAQPEETPAQKRERADWLRYQKSLARLKSERDDLAAQKAAFDEHVKRFNARAEAAEKVEAALKSGDLEALKQFGLDLNALNRAALEKGKPDAKMSALEKELAELRKRLEGEEQAKTERERQERVAQGRQELLRQAQALPALSWFAGVYGAENTLADIETLAAKAGIRSASDPRLLQLAEQAAAEHRAALAASLAEKRAAAEAAEAAEQSASRGKAPPRTITARTTGETSGGTRPASEDDYRAAGLKLLKERQKAGALG